MGVDQVALVQQVLAVAPEGALAVMDRDLPAHAGGPSDRVRLARLQALAQLTRGKAALWVNGRVDLALAAGADGVQLPERGLPAEAVQRAFPGLLLGRSCHDRAGLLEAARAGVDWALLSPVAAPKSKPLPPGVAPLGVGGFLALSREVDVPVFALGGVDEALARALSSRGATRAATIGALLASKDPARAALRLLGALVGAARTG